MFYITFLGFWCFTTGKTYFNTTVIILLVSCTWGHGVFANQSKNVSTCWGQTILANNSFKDHALGQTAARESRILLSRSGSAIQNTLEIEGI